MQYLNIAELFASLCATFQAASCIHALVLCCLDKHGRTGRAFDPDRRMATRQCVVALCQTGTQSMQRLCDCDANTTKHVSGYSIRMTAAWVGPLCRSVSDWRLETSSSPHVQANSCGCASPCPCNPLLQVPGSHVVQNNRAAGARRRR